MKSSLLSLVDEKDGMRVNIFFTHAIFFLKTDRQDPLPVIVDEFRYTDKTFERRIKYSGVPFAIQFKTQIKQTNVS